MKLFSLSLISIFLFLTFLLDPAQSDNRVNSIQSVDEIAITIRVLYQTNLSFTPQLFLRGNVPPLAWTNGYPLNPIGNGQYVTRINVSLSDLQQSNMVLEMKCLINDRDWQLGANSMFKLNADQERKMVDSAQSFTLSIYPWFYATEGIITTIPNIYSPQLKNYRNLTIYYPPSYSENVKKIYDNLLIMHDGQNLFDPATAFLGNAWMIQNTLNPLIVNSNPDYSISDLVVIGVDNTPDRLNEYTYSKDPQYGGGKGDMYLNFLQETIIPLIPTINSRLVVNKDNLGMLGSSLGGLISCYAGWSRSNTYSKVGCMSSSFWWNNQVSSMGCLLTVSEGF